MTLNTCRDLLLAWFSEYWGNATVKWGAVSGVKNKAPLVTLQTGAITRSNFPNSSYVNGFLVTSFGVQTTLQVDLFTNGQPITIAGRETQYQNTAVSDLMAFINYIESQATLEWSDKNDLTVQMLNGIQDLTEVVNDSQWSYRAMCELTISFTQWTADFNGIVSEVDIVFEDGVPVDVVRQGFVPTASGGGTEELYDGESGSFEGFDIRPTF